jgi:hypothetical protein
MKSLLFDFSSVEKIISVHELKEFRILSLRKGE